MKFTFSEHAKTRMRQRSVPNPNDIKLSLAKNKIKKRILKNCNRIKSEKDLFYFKGERSDFEILPIYVCALITKNEYWVITCFWLDESYKK